MRRMVGMLFGGVDVVDVEVETDERVNVVRIFVKS
jgi:hypothetical protein